MNYARFTSSWLAFTNTATSEFRSQFPGTSGLPMSSTGSIQSCCSSSRNLTSNFILCFQSQCYRCMCWVIIKPYVGFCVKMLRRISYWSYEWIWTFKRVILEGIRNRRKWHFLILKMKVDHTDLYHHLRLIQNIITKLKVLSKINLNYLLFYYLVK